MPFVFPEYSATLVHEALEAGAAHAVPFSLQDVPFDPRTLLKCMFGCDDWGKGLTCPSRKNNVSLKEYREMLERYQWGILIHGHDKHTTQRISYLLEQQAFAKGHYFAMSFSDCGLCNTWDIKTRMLPALTQRRRGLPCTRWASTCLPWQGALTCPSIP